MVKMTDAQYLEAATKVAEVAQRIAHLPIERMLEVCRAAHTLGPILDPTAYAQGMGNVREMEELLEPLLGVKATVQAMKAKALAAQRQRTKDATTACMECGCPCCKVLAAGLPAEAEGMASIAASLAGLDCARAEVLERARARLAIMEAHA